MMDRGEVGLVMVRDSARLTRDPEAGERFLTKALRAGILLEVNGELIDLARVRPVELFGLRLHNMLAWWENEQRKNLFQQAKTAQIGLGKATITIVVGSSSAVTMQGMSGLRNNPKVTGSSSKIIMKAT